MIRISCFKHEREILLYSQTLQIASTQSFEKDDGKLVDHLMKSLHNTKKTMAIVDRDSFLLKIGVQFKTEWISLIVHHPLLPKLDEDKKKGILGFGPHWTFFDLYSEAIIFQDGVFSFDLNFGQTSTDAIALHPSLLPENISSELQKCAFKIAIDGVSIALETKYEFRVPKEFRIYCNNHTSSALKTSESHSEITLFVGPKDDGSDMIRLRTVTYHNRLSRYELNQDEPLEINNVLDVAPFGINGGGNGTIHIECTSDISIAQNGGINADGVGLREQDHVVNDYYEKWFQQRMEKQYTEILEEQPNSAVVYLPQETEFGTTSASAYLMEQFRLANNVSMAGNGDILLRYGMIRNFKSVHEKDDALGQTGVGGGIVALQSSGNIANNGVISSKGIDSDNVQGGSICLYAAGAVENHGFINCDCDGSIVMRCVEFLNEGQISPVPEITIVSEFNQKRIEIVTAYLSKTEAENDRDRDDEHRQDANDDYDYDFGNRSEIISKRTERM